MGQSSDTLVKGNLAQRFLTEARAQGWDPDNYDMNQVVFRTCDEELYEYISKIAYRNAESGLGFTFKDPETQKSYSTPIRSR